MKTWDDVKEIVSKEVFDTIYDDLVDREHQTQFYTFPGGFTFILRSLAMKSEELSYKTEHFVYLEKTIYSYNDELKEFELFTNNLDTFLDEVYERFENNKRILLLYSSEVDKMEDVLYERRMIASFMDNWFDLKKDIARIDRFFNRQLFAYKDLIKFGDKKEDFPSLDFNNMIADIKFALSSAQGLISRLDNLNNYYTSLKNDKLNRNIYLLTILSGVFLPLNLIVGFFGMNTEGLFFTGQPQGTIYVVYILAGIVTIFLIGFNLLKIIDKFLLKWIIGRTSIYKRLAKKIESIEEKWKY